MRVGRTNEWPKATTVDEDHEREWVFLIFALKWCILVQK